jgi:hypothetical protein
MTTNAIALQTNAFSITRVSKTGKQSTRGLLGLIIEGTPAERLETGLLLSREAWDNGNMLVLLSELSRVFAGRTWDMSVAFVGIKTANPDKVKMIQLCEALVRFHADAKGIKVKYVALCSDIVEWAKEEAARKEARRLAFEESQKTLAA